ncbi:arrestin domain conatining protein [Microthyrium microscopicum]|uniref:Arrestin domain conatining protein n=1 Tax=Microthyrium microscopicum TaxID=703497 RepID=A0A6A6U825_9PEZI|nr:arrestin domain conatining protein [Microthyrium microscopicum]
MSSFVPATVRVTGTPNSNFLVGYPGISATLPRIEGKVEIRPYPTPGWAAPMRISFIKIALQRRETIHPAADNIKKHLAAPRKDITDIVGTEMLLYRCAAGKEHDTVLCMDLPFVIFIPYGREGVEVARRVPPASLSLPSRTAETFYELVVTVQQGKSDQKKFLFPVPITRYETLSSFGMYDKPESAEQTSDHLVTLGISIPRWSFGPLDPISVYVKVSPNPDWMNKAKRVTVKNITISIEEEIIYNHEGDEPTKKTRSLGKTQQQVGMKLPEAGYFTNLGLVFPAKDLRDNDGIQPRGDRKFPVYNVSGFTTTGSLYKIQYFLVVKAQLGSAKDIILRKPIIVCPFDHATCKEEMRAIEEAAKEAAKISRENPMAPAQWVANPKDAEGLKTLGFCQGGTRYGEGRGECRNSGMGRGEVI